MAHETVPTMTVIRFGEPVRINVTDYDPEADQLPDGESAPIVEPTVEPTVESTVESVAANQLGLMKKGRRYFVVNLATSEPVELDGIDAEGYTTEAAAIEAAQAAMAG